MRLKCPFAMPWSLVSLLGACAVEVDDPSCDMRDRPPTKYPSLVARAYSWLPLDGGWRFSNFVLDKS